MFLIITEVVYLALSSSGMKVSLLDIQKRKTISKK